MPLSDPLKVVQKATEIFENAGIEYLVGGSLASSLYGIPRSTQDVDIVADLSLESIEKIIPPLRDYFFIDEEAARKAVKARTPFNIIDREYIYKLDIFVLGVDDLSVMEMKRRIRYQIAESDNQAFFVCSPEDIIAHKLYWYKLGNEVSERQWNDALNVVKVQRDFLDMNYLYSVCRARGVLTFLKRLLAQK